MLAVASVGWPDPPRRPSQGVLHPVDGTQHPAARRQPSSLWTSSPFYKVGGADRAATSCVRLTHSRPIGRWRKAGSLDVSSDHVDRLQPTRSTLEEALAAGPSRARRRCACSRGACWERPCEQGDRHRRTSTRGDARPYERPGSADAATRGTSSRMRRRLAATVIDAIVSATYASRRRSRPARSARESRLVHLDGLRQRRARGTTPRLHDGAKAITASPAPRADSSNSRLDHDAAAHAV